MNIFEPKRMSCDGYDELRASGKTFVAIDVRTKPEWDKGHLEDAIHVPLADLESEADSVVSQLDTPVIMCCEFGGRAKQGAELLTRAGYTNVYVLEGGYSGYCHR